MNQSFICKTFGHGSRLNMLTELKVQGDSVDCDGKLRLYLESECPRCDEKYFVGHVIVPERKQDDSLISRKSGVL